MKKWILLLVLLMGCHILPLKPQLVVFTASWCRPCQRAQPIVDRLARHVKVIHYDFDRDKAAVRRYKIKSVPTFILGKLRTHDIREVIRALNLQEEFAKTFADTLEGDALSSCSRWAAARRIMGGDFSGPYGWKYHPWVKGLHDTWAGSNYVMKGAQLGITEVAINRTLYTLDKLHRDVLYVLPTARGASKFSKGRFSTALAMSPYIKNMFTDLNSVDLKQAGQNTMYLSGSRGNNNLKNIPVSELILDEVDEMDQKQIWLALERLSGQLRKCVWGISTPTVPEHGIHLLYKGSTQEHFYFKCPHCGRRTELVWPECVEVIGEHSTDVRCKESFLKCKECKAKLDQKAKPDFLASGKWESTANANPDIRGFYINQLYSYTVDAGELAVSFLRGHGDEFAATEFWNSKLGLPFIGQGAQVTEQMLANVIANHSMKDARPESSGRLITLGVDLGNTCHAVVCEWFIDGNAAKDLSAAAMCKVLWVGTFPGDNLEYLDELMREWQVLYAVVDADPYVNEMRRFARRYPGFVGLTRYRRVKVAKEITTSEEHTGAPMHTIDRTNWLSSALSRFKGRVRIQLPCDIPYEFQQHMMSTVRTFKKDLTGNPIATYLNTSADHFLHALLYAEIGLHQMPLSFDTKVEKVL